MPRKFLVALSVTVVLLVGGAQAADSLPLTLVSQTSTTITLGWVPQPGYGYLFSADGALVSRTNDQTRSTVTFAKGASSYEVAVIVKGATGTYAPTLPPPLAACADGIDNDQDGKIDYPADPGCTSTTDTDETDTPPSAGQVLVSPSGNDTSCGRNNGIACQTFQRAYTVAALGDTVVAQGSFPSQTMGYLASKGSEQNDPDVRFVGQGATVAGLVGYGVRHLTLDNISFGSSQVIFECETSGVPAGAAGQHPVDVTVQNSRMSSTRSENANMLTYRDNVIGPSSSVIKVGASGDTGCTDNAPSQITFEGNDIHNFREASSASHMECIFVEGVRGLVLRRNVIRGCSVFTVFFKAQLAAGAFGMSNILIENNFLGHPVASAYRSAGSTALSFSGGSGLTYSNLVIRGNSINGKVLLRDDLGVKYTGSVTGNIIESRGGSCSALNWSGNALLSTGFTGKCPNDIAEGINPGWVNRETSAEINSSTSDPTIDYHLVDGAWPIGKSSLGNLPADDFDRQVRPLGAPDLGADER